MNYFSFMDVDYSKQGWALALPDYNEHNVLVFSYQIFKGNFSAPQDLNLIIYPDQIFNPRPAHGLIYTYQKDSFKNGYSSGGFRAILELLFHRFAAFQRVHRCY